jgi:hypothetical protein
VHWQNDGEDRDGADYGQVDGDASAAVQFQPGSAGQPWLRGGLPPWHMWGNSIPLRVDSTGLDEDHPVLISQQVTRISYKRPETWSFWLAGRLTSNVPMPGPAFVAMVFNIYTGVGRSSFQTSQPVPATGSVFNQLGFCKLLWNLGMGDIPSAAPVKYTTRCPTPPLDDRDATSTQIVEWIPAQDIQVTAQLIVLPILVPEVVVYEAEAHAYFAPRSHIRPEWYAKGPPELQYRGDEIGGM